jgi:hypothetical protein
MVFGGICVGRIFWFPLMLITDYSAYLNNNLETGRLGATVVGDPMANSYLPQSGYVRAIIAIVFLALSAFFFIISGIIAYKKSVRYHQYMQGKDISKGV